MQVHGQCHCGQVSFTALVNPSDVVVCHCTDCQVFSGAPMRASVRTPAAQVQLVGQPTEYIKTADSGRQRVQGFCGRCGSNLYTTDFNDRSLMGLRLGCIRERAQLMPQSQVWAQSAMDWAIAPELGTCWLQGPNSRLRPRDGVQNSRHARSSPKTG